MSWKNEADLRSFQSQIKNNIKTNEILDLISKSRELK